MASSGKVVLNAKSHSNHRIQINQNHSSKILQA